MSPPMTTYARGCCYTGLEVCARAYTCPCHWDDRRPAAVKGGAAGVHRDPAANEAIRNVMREKGQK